MSGSSTRTRTRPRTTLAEVASSAGVSVATVSQGRQRAHRRVSRDPRARAGPARPHRLPPPRRPPGGATRPAIELAFEGDLHAYSAEIIQGVVDAAAPTGTHVVVTRRPTGAPPVDGPPDDWARDLADSGVRALIAVTSIMSAEQLAALGRAGVHLVVIDPLELPNVDVTSVGSTNFVGGPLGRPAPARPRAPPHRLPRRTPRAACNQARMQRLPRRARAGRRRRARRLRAVLALHVCRRRASAALRCSTCRCPRPPSSPRPTRSRSASWRRPAPGGCASRRTSASSASTTPSSRACRRRRSRRCASRSPRWGGSPCAPRCDSSRGSRSTRTTSSSPPSSWCASRPCRCPRHLGAEAASGLTPPRPPRPAPAVQPASPLLRRQPPDRMIRRSIAAATAPARVSTPSLV